MTPTANPAPTENPDEDKPTPGGGEGDPAEPHPHEPKVESPAADLGEASEEGRAPTGGEQSGHNEDVEESEAGGGEGDLAGPREDEPGVNPAVLDGED